MWEALLDAFLDTLKVFPFLFAVFIAISFIEERMDAAKHIRAVGRFAPLVSSAAGVIPQCGISVMAAKLFQEGCISVGALLAAFISVSDEAVILLLSSGKWKAFLLLAAIKFVLGAAAGFIADAIVKKPMREGGAEHEYSGCHHSGKGESAAHKYLLHPLLHCLKTLAFILVINVVLALAVYFFGQDKLNSLMRGAGYFTPFACALVGLIPSCASSVLVVRLYIFGGIGFSGLVAGLIANAGVGLALLFRNKRDTITGLYMIIILFTIAVAAGEIIMLI